MNTIPDPDSLGPVAELPEQTIKRLTAELERARRVLRPLEWAHYANYRGDPFHAPGIRRVCPSCGAWENDGHKADCPMKAALASGER